MSKGSDKESERKSIFTSAKNRVSKIGTAIKSAAEYGLFEGIGKTAKNFASGAATGAKQGYDYFNNDISKDLAKLEEIVAAQLKLRERASTLKDKNYIQLGFKDKVQFLVKKSKELSQMEVNHQLSPSNTEIKTQWPTIQPLAYKLSQSLNKMYDKRAKQPDFIATTRKIETLKNQLDKIELPNLAGAAGISNGEAYKNAQTYEEKIDLIRIKLEADKKKSIPQSHIDDSKSKIKNLEEDQQLTNTSFEDIKKTVDDLNKIRSTTPNNQHSIETHLKRLETAQQTLADLRAAEEQLLKPKQNRAVRALKTASGVIAGTTIGALKGSGSAIKTAAKAVKNAPTGIKKTYQKNRGKKQHSRG